MIKTPRVMKKFGFKETSRWTLYQGENVRKPTTPSLLVISNQKASDVYLSPAHPKMLRKEDQTVQTIVSGGDFWNSYESRRDCGTRTDPLKRMLTVKEFQRWKWNVNMRSVYDDCVCIVAEFVTCPQRVYNCASRRRVFFLTEFKQTEVVRLRYDLVGGFLWDREVCHILNSKPVVFEG